VLPCFALCRCPAARLLWCTGSVFLASSVALRGQLAADSVKFTPGALGPGAQLPARLLEHLGAGLQGGPQLVPLAGRRMSVSWRYCPMPGSGLGSGGVRPDLPQSW
jgi:hypothetical protein